MSSIIRGPDGEVKKVKMSGDDPEDKSTRKIKQRSHDSENTDEMASGDDATEMMGSNDDFDDDDALSGDKTVVFKQSDEDKRKSKGSRDGMDDPVVGWIVVIDGPGKGLSLPLGYGMNSIGRNSSERISLDFGDKQISRSNHATITYDPRGRKFFIQHGGGKVLTYLGGAAEPVLAPTELKGASEITIGETKLRFVPFCDTEFDWNQT